MKNLNEMTSKELKQLGKEKGVKNWWTLNKAALIEALSKVEVKKQFKDKCDICGEYKECQGYEGQVVCNDCIAEIEEQKQYLGECEELENVNPIVEEDEEVIENNEVEELEEIDIPTPLDEVKVEVKKPKARTSKKAKIHTGYLPNKDLQKDCMYAIVTPNEYDIHEFLELTNKHLKENDWPQGELVVEDTQETFEIAFSKVKGQSKQQWHAICKAFTQAKKDILK